MGFNWLTYFAFTNPLMNYIDNMQSGWLSPILDRFQEWGGFTYADELMNVGRSIAVIMGNLPTPILYLMGYGMALTLVGALISMIIRLL